MKRLNRRIKWTEKDEWDDGAHLCTFAQIEGDYSKYEGRWSFEEQDGNTLVKLRIDFEMDVPLIGALLKTIVTRLMKTNCDSMLDALAAEAEQVG